MIVNSVEKLGFKNLIPRMLGKSTSELDGISKKAYTQLLNEAFESKRWNRKEEENFIKTNLEK